MLGWMMAAAVAGYIAGLTSVICLRNGAGAALWGERTRVPGSSQMIPAEFLIQVRLIPQRQQRYDTAGDWTWAGNTLRVSVSRELADKDPRCGILLFTHELIEALLCRSSNVTGAQVDSFDMSHPDEDEPGGNPAAPYHRQHIAAEAAEKALARQLEVDWNDYLASLQ
jgi:hypothetical protein